VDASASTAPCPRLTVTHGCCPEAAPAPVAPYQRPYLL
jgi:hypothetical protein